ncbi:PREDICTED: DNA-directed RNA polymerase III subunit RPC7-like [Trachymyrmex cornetzi]|uniref:DNA-directed RNA polymerase III subunit n=1 Tax=Trachymyrmex cornetzi TaxID=471704 RepID=A0A195EEV8_9HYME|nr:PREDICTED: DNA-directed RNA polymerase III subunit RPC7-like [Trachymyrmex cornetzi]KYN26773.1 DNA-directed RNA polymerase III subunit RPC7 [Trachymyrmex cornetzi]
MAGRGRGKSAMSFSMEQLGLSKGETLSTPVPQPSLSYPPLDHKPPPIQITNEMEYLVELKRHFTEYMRESPYYVKATVINEDIERYSDAFKEDFTDNDESKYEAYHDWSLMPEELRTSRKRKLRKNPEQKENNKKKDIVDIVKKLSELEKKENMQHPAEEEDKEGNEEENDEEKDDSVKEEEEDEMDDGTDYANEYFENGDNYYSEDEVTDDQFFDA